MASVAAMNKREHYRTEIISPSGNTLIADEPVSNGGEDLGFSPTELLASSLAACTCVTLRMYADRKGWELDHIYVDVNVAPGEGKTLFARKIKLSGNLDAQQLDRLLYIANACPISRILSNPIDIQTVLE
jgi:putative redox protein